MAQLKVVTKSVFSGSKLVVRKLTLDKICGVLDIPKDIRQYFRTRVNLPFLKHPPLKVLAQVGFRMVQEFSDVLKKEFRGRKESKWVGFSVQEEATEFEEVEKLNKVAAKNDDEEIRLKLWDISALKEFK